MAGLKNMLRIGDWIIIAFLLTMGITGWILQGAHQKMGDTAVIYINGRESGRIVLRQAGTKEVQGPLGSTVIKTGNGYVWIHSSPCSNKLCIQMGRANRNGEILVCVPNRVMIRVSRRQENGIDGYTM